MKYLKKIYLLIVFIANYLVKLVQANLYIAYDILTPGSRTNPVIVEVPVTITSDFVLLLFSNLISMTPGTLSLDITTDKKIIVVHFLYKKEEQNLLEEIHGLQLKLNQIFTR